MRVPRVAPKVGLPTVVGGRNPRFKKGPAAASGGISRLVAAGTDSSLRSSFSERWWTEFEASPPPHSTSFACPLGRGGAARPGAAAEEGASRRGRRTIRQDGGTRGKQNIRRLWRAHGPALHHWCVAAETDMLLGLRRASTDSPDTRAGITTRSGLVLGGGAPHLPTEHSGEAQSHGYPGGALPHGASASLPPQLDDGLLDPVVGLRNSLLIKAVYVTAVCAAVAAKDWTRNSLPRFLSLSSHTDRHTPPPLSPLRPSTNTPIERKAA